MSHPHLIVIVVFRIASARRSVVVVCCDFAVASVNEQSQLLLIIAVYTNVYF